MRKRVKFLLLLFAGACIFMPPLFFFILHAPLSFYGILFTTQILGWFFIYSYLIYRSVYKGQKPKYPIVPPEGRTDIYLPRLIFPDRSMKTRDATQNPSNVKKWKSGKKRGKGRRAESQRTKADVNMETSDQLLGLLKK